MKSLFRAVSLFLFLVAYLQAEEKPIRIGVIAPISGDLSIYGTAAVNGLTLANKQIKGPKVELVVEDNKSCGATDAVPAVQKLINIDKVDLVVTVCTGAAQGVLPILKARKIPLFQVTEAGPDPDRYMIKMMPESIGFVDILADKFSASYSKMALIGATIQVNIGERGNLPLFKKKFEDRGGSIVFLEEFPSEVVDFRTTIERIRRSGAQAVTPFLAPSQQLVAFLKQADELNLWKDVSLAGNFFFEFMLKDLSTTYPNFSKLEGLVSSNLAQTTSAKFMDDYKAEFGQGAPQFADYSYDAMTIIKRCRLDRSCYRNPFDGVSGRIEFSADSDLRVGKFELRSLQHGSFKTLG